MDKLENIKKRKRRVSNSIKRLVKRQKILGHEENLLEKKLITIYDDNIIWFTKKGMVDTLSFLDIPHVLILIICDYGYQARYKKYNCYESAHYKSKIICEYDSIPFKDYLVEYTKDALYISNIFTGEIFDVVKIYLSGDTSKNFERIFGNLYIHDNHHDSIVYKVNLENNKCSVTREDEKVSKRVIDACYEEENCDKLFDSEEIRMDIANALKKEYISLCTDVFNIDENNHLSVSVIIDDKDDFLVTINDANNKYILEYDLNTKNVIELYKLDTYHIPKKQFMFSFNHNHFSLNEYVFSDKTDHRFCFTYRKCIV